MQLTFNPVTNHKTISVSPYILALCIFIALFLNGVIETLVHSPWCPVPCMYWTAALASLDDPALVGCWDDRSLTVVMSVLDENFILSDRRIRQATCCYLLTAVLHLCQVHVSVLV